MAHCNSITLHKDIVIESEINWCEDIVIPLRLLGECLFGFSFYCTLFFKIKSIVLSSGTLVNRLFTSKEIILYPVRIVSSLSLLIMSFIFKMLYSDLVNGVNSLVKYLAIS